MYNYFTLKLFIISFISHLYFSHFHFFFNLFTWATETKDYLIREIITFLINLSDANNLILITLMLHFYFNSSNQTQDFKLLTKRLEKKLDGNYTRMLQAILNRSWQQHPTRRQLYSHLSRKLYKLDEPDMPDTAGEAKTMCSCGPPHMANQKQDDQLEHSYSSYVMIRDVTPKTCRRRGMIGRRGERGSGISVLAARHDDDDDSFHEFNIESTNSFFKSRYLFLFTQSLYHKVNLQ